VTGFFVKYSIIALITHMNLVHNEDPPHQTSTFVAASSQFPKDFGWGLPKLPRPVMNEWKANANKKGFMR